MKIQLFLYFLNIELQKDTIYNSFHEKGDPYD